MFGGRRIGLVCLLLVACCIWEGAAQYQSIQSYFPLPAGTIDFCNKSNGCQLDCIDGTHPLGGYTCNTTNGILEVNPITSLIYQAMKSAAGQQLTVNYIAGNSVDLVTGKLTFSYSVSTAYPDYVIVALAQTVIANEFKNYGINMDPSRIQVSMKAPIFSLTILLPKSITVSVPSSSGNITQLNLRLFEYYHLNISSLVDQALMGAIENASYVSVYFIESLAKPQNQDPNLAIRSCNFAKLLASNATVQDMFTSCGYEFPFSSVISTDPSCQIYATPAPSSVPTPVPSPPLQPTPDSSSIRSTLGRVFLWLCILIVIKF